MDIQYKRCPTMNMIWIAGRKTRGNTSEKRQKKKKLVKKRNSCQQLGLGWHIDDKVH